MQIEYTGNKPTTLISAKDCERGELYKSVDKHSGQPTGGFYLCTYHRAGTKYKVYMVDMHTGISHSGDEFDVTIFAHVDATLRVDAPHPYRRRPV